MTRRLAAAARPDGGGTQGGFTLLEVLIALAIMGLAVVASIQGFSQGLRLLKLSGDHQRAILVADQKAREVLQFDEGIEEGFEGDFRWTRTTRLVPAPELTPLNGEPLWRVWQVLVRVQWDEHRFLDVTTLRTVPRNADAIAEPIPAESAGQGPQVTGQQGSGRPPPGQPPGTGRTPFSLRRGQ